MSNYQHEMCTTLKVISKTLKEMSKDIKEINEKKDETYYLQKKKLEEEQKRILYEKEDIVAYWLRYANIITLCCAVGIILKNTVYIKKNNRLIKEILIPLF
jgi:hypothetical protein